MLWYRPPTLVLMRNRFRLNVWHKFHIEPKLRPISGERDALSNFSRVEMVGSYLNYHQ